MAELLFIFRTVIFSVLRSDGGSDGSRWRPHRGFGILHLLRLGATGIERQRADRRLQLFPQED